MENPIRKRLEELQISMRAAARILDLSPTTVSRHCGGTRRLSADNMELYNVRLGIPMNKLREWNKHIKGAVNEAARKQKPDNLR